MRNLLFLLAFVALSFGSVAAQTKTANFAGEWTLDLKKSELPRMMQNVESVTMTIAQDDKTLKTTIATKGGMREMPAQTATFNLDGTETTAEGTGGGMMGGAATMKAAAEKDGKLKLNTVRKLNFQGNDVTITTKETWELMDDGKTLKITRTSESPRGEQTSTLYFTKAETKKS